MSKVKIWENMVDYCNLSVSMLEIEGVSDFTAGQNETWALQLENSILIIPKGNLVIEAFEEDE